jgi:hypothetical protein
MEVFIHHIRNRAVTEDAPLIRILIVGFHSHVPSSSILYLKEKAMPKTSSNFEEFLD